jgi:hypothetical protein
MKDKYIKDVEPMIIGWLKSGSKNTTALAYVIAKYIDEKINDLNNNHKLATSLNDQNVIILAKPNYLAKDGSIKEAERFVNQETETIIYYCHKDDLYK